MTFEFNTFFANVIKFKSKYYIETDLASKPFVTVFMYGYCFD